MTALTYQEAMASAEIDQNQNNILPMLIPMSLQLPLLVPLPISHCARICHGPAGPLPPQPQHWCGDVADDATYGRYQWRCGLQINAALFTNLMVAPLPMNFYHQMGMGAAAGQMGMGALAGLMGMGPDGQMDMVAKNPIEIDPFEGPLSV